MQYITYYQSPLGEIMLSADNKGLAGLYLEGQKHFIVYNKNEYTEQETPVLKQTSEWLDIYFSGNEPDFMPPLNFNGSDFQKSVWEILLTIPYGKTMTYGEIAHKIAEKRGLARMSAQAVGGAVGRNPISIIVPCHRVVGAGGNLTGYAGGLDKKIKLLKLEGGFKETFFIPKQNTAL